MIQQPQPQKMDALQDISSRDGVRGAVKRIHEMLTNFFNRDIDFKRGVFGELSFAYGELDYTPSLLANGAQTLVSITVPGAIPGYVAQVSYDQDLQALVMGTPYVSAADTVDFVLFNNTGGNITLASGRFRCYVWPRVLTP